MEYIKKIKILLVLLLIGVIIYAAPLSVETLAPARPLMPWQQFFLACAARLGQRDSKKAEGVEKVEAAVASKDKEAAKAALIAATATIESAATKGVYHKNNSARKVSRLAKLVNSMA